ncbi:MAG: hypothetical protein GX224_01835 [Thermoplasmatales archaeon]|nr:hypothetical protein [Thermoplasmatales archaeon]
MSYRIPSEERLAEAIFVVTYRRKQIGSQREMVEAVLEELSKDGEGYRVSGERIRRVAVENDVGDLTIEYSEREGALPEECPVCRGRMEPVTNADLSGRMVEIGRKCASCPYSTGMRRRVPSRYTFSKARR